MSIFSGTTKDGDTISVVQRKGKERKGNNGSRSCCKQMQSITTARYDLSGVPLWNMCVSTCLPVGCTCSVAGYNTEG